MRALVSFERVIGVEAFLADVARKRARILVDVSDVFQLAGFGFERSSAHIAEELTVVGVHGHMFGQVTLGSEGLVTDLAHKLELPLYLLQVNLFVLTERVTPLERHAARVTQVWPVPGVVRLVSLHVLLPLRFVVALIALICQILHRVCVNVVRFEMDLVFRQIRHR